MSFSSLPEELIENIAHFVDTEPRWGAKDNFKHILSLSLVSRQTLSSSRRVLYREPFDRWAFQKESKDVTWKNARSLLESLEANNNRFGKLVRRTRGIESWISKLDQAQQKIPDALTYEDAFWWYKRVLQACTLLHQVDFLFSTEAQLHSVFDTITYNSSTHNDSSHSSRYGPPLSTLRAITFGRCHIRLSDTPRVDASQSISALENSSISALDTVTISDPSWLMEEDSSTICSFPLSVRRLEIMTSFGRLTPWLLLFTRSKDTLEHVKLDGNAPIDGSDFSALSQTLGTNLRTLSLHLNSNWIINRSLSTYTSHRDTPPLRPETFASFPHLENLTLSATHGPSLHLLETLANSSPLLLTLRFSCSRWISSLNPSSIDLDDVFPEREISTVLSKFHHLFSVVLGILPTLDRSRYRGLQDSLSKKGIWASYSVCDKE